LKLLACRQADKNQPPNSKKIPISNTKIQHFKHAHLELGAWILVFVWFLYLVPWILDFLDSDPQQLNAWHRFKSGRGYLTGQPR
jgi:hypothetical protein